MEGPTRQKGRQSQEKENEESREEEKAEAEKPAETPGEAEEAACLQVQEEQAPRQGQGWQGSDLKAAQKAAQN